MTLDFHLVDAHAHLNEIDNIEPVLADAEAAGVKRIVAVGMDQVSNQKTQQLAKRFPTVVFPAIGYHPWVITEGLVGANLAYLKSCLSRCVALGEIGLDYKVKVNKRLQRDVFAQLLQLAVRYRKPVIVHCRYSHQRAHQMVAASGIRRAVFHWYSGPLDVLDRILEDGYYISATPALAYSPSHQAAVARAPLERVLIETDSPVAYQGQNAVPAHLVKTLAELSRIKQRSPHNLARVTTANAENFYGLVPLETAGA